MLRESNVCVRRIRSHLTALAALSMVVATADVAAQGGSAGTDSASGASKQLQRCDKPLGTVAVVEPQEAVAQVLARVQLGSPTGLIRLIIQQSNCFLVVERGMAMQNVMQERALAESGQLRQGSNVGGGQLAAADFLLTPSVLFSEGNAGGVGGIAAGIAGRLNPLFGLAAGGLKFKEAQTSMLLTDAHSGIQVAAAQGKAKKADWGLGGLSASASSLMAAGAYSNTNEGKVIASSLLDNFNKIVLVVRTDTSLQRTRRTLKDEAGVRADAGAAFAEGDVLTPKIAGIRLFAEPRESAKALAVLGKTDEVVFLGKETDGYLSVQAANAAGWVRKLMVSKR